MCVCVCVCVCVGGRIVEGGAQDGRDPGVEGWEGEA
jgi:hypothetical protein